jgi:hypothetical protein
MSRLIVFAFLRAPSWIFESFVVKSGADAHSDLADDNAGLHRLGNGNELIQCLSPTVVESHRLMLFAGIFIAVDNERGVFRPRAMRLKRDHGGKLKRAEVRHGRRLRRPVTWFEGIGPDELFVLDDFKIATDVRKFLSVR